MSSIYGTSRMQEHPARPIALDQQIALRHATERLACDFAGTLGGETIEQFVVSSYAEFANRATVVHFLPLLAERFARQRLLALVRHRGPHHDGQPVVLFLCTRNAGHSQMALGFFTHHAGDAAVAWSGGSIPATSVNGAAIAAMAERGIDISAEYPKPWTEEVVRAADVVITMGCGDACPVFPGKRYEDWEVADPDGLDLPAVRCIRDDLERRVLTLIDELHLRGPPRDPLAQTCPAVSAPNSSGGLHRWSPSRSGRPGRGKVPMSPDERRSTACRRASTWCLVSNDCSRTHNADPPLGCRVSSRDRPSRGRLVRLTHPKLSAECDPAVDQPVCLRLEVGKRRAAFG